MLLLDCLLSLEIDVCSMDPPVCSQLCVKTRRPGGYECSCVDGYQLTSDRHHCVVSSSLWQSWKSSTALMFYTQAGRVISRSVRSGTSGKVVYRATGLVSALGLRSDLFKLFCMVLSVVNCLDNRPIVRFRRGRKFVVLIVGGRAAS